MKMAYISNGLLLMLFGIVDFVIMHNLLKEMFPQFASLAILIFTMVLLGVVTLLQGLILKNEVKSKSFWLDKTYDISIDDSNDSRSRCFCC
jgi:ABC-type maltose transport system permease subunit